MKNLLVSAAFLALFGLGCRKVEVGPPGFGDPIFSLKGQLDGQPLDWQAGKNDRYMLAAFDDSVAGGPRFLADLGQLGSLSANGFPKIVIEFFGDGSTGNWQNFLTARTVEFAENQPVLISKRVLSLQNQSKGQSPFSSLWTIGGQVSGAYSPIFEFDDLNFSGQITLQSTDSKGRTTSQSRFLDLEQKREWSIRLFKDQNVASAMLSDSIGAIFWSTGDSLSSSIFIDSTVAEVAATATFLGGRTAYASLALDLADPFGQDYAAADFTWSSFVKTDSSTGNGTFQPGRLRVSFINEAGQIFRSDFAKQGASNFFEIVSVEPFERNEAGVLTQKVVVKFDCVLADEKGQTRRFSAFEGTVAVGVPD